MERCIEASIVSAEVFIDMVINRDKLSASHKGILTSVMHDLDQYLHTGDGRITDLKLKLIDLVYDTKGE